jgi:hypothetical protein
MVEMWATTVGPQAIQSNIDVRAATFLLSTDEAFVKAGVLNPAFLAALLKPRAHLSRLTLLHLVRAFLVYFDRLGDQHALLALATFVRGQLARHARGEDALARNASNRTLIFAFDGPAKVVSNAVMEGRSLEDQLDYLALTGYGKGRYQSICRFRFYIETLKKIPVGKDHQVLKQLIQPAVYNAPGTEGGKLGHEVLGILIDRSTVEGVSETWRGVILAVAGDPRVPKGHRRYQEWWALLGEERVQKVRGWLSRFDLSLFLGALKDYGQASRDVDLQRMFPARKRFLEGLVEQGLVVTSRLFVGNGARDYLRRNYRRDELPEYANVSDTHRSMIYLQIGHCHMIEGSHNCKLWIFPKLPSKTAVASYGTKNFTPRELGGEIHRLYQAEFGRSAIDPAAIRHIPHNFRWQHEAIRYFGKQGIRLVAEKFFSATDYRQYKRDRGVQVWPG